MGFCLAEECACRGAKVILVSGPVNLQCSESIERIDVESTKEMYDAVVARFPEADVAILSAAVADFKPQVISDMKIKREGKGLTLQLQSTQDIAAAVGKMKKHHQRIVAFALEVSNEETNAKQKLERKNADFIVLNSTRIPNTTFRSDDNQITIISHDRKVYFEKKSKKDVAKDIVNELKKIL